MKARAFLILWILIGGHSWMAHAQGYYPLATGNHWEYWELPSYYAWTTRATLDTIMPNGLVYSFLEKDLVGFGYTGHFRQDSAQVYQFTEDETDQLRYDFSKTTGDTVFVRYDQGDTVVMTVLYDRVQNIFGRQLRQLGFYERFLPTTLYTLFEVTDSLGLTAIESEGSPRWTLVGAIIDSTQYGTITSIERDARTIASDLALLQNFPNPFNPSTVITYEVSNRGKVQIDVFDLLGRTVATLFSGMQEPGEHSVVWDPQETSSGVYFYRLVAGQQVITRKMMFVR